MFSGRVPGTHCPISMGAQAPMAPVLTAPLSRNIFRNWVLENWIISLGLPRTVGNSSISTPEDIRLASSLWGCYRQTLVVSFFRHLWCRTDRLHFILEPMSSSSGLWSQRLALLCLWTKMFSQPLTDLLGLLDGYYRQDSLYISTNALVSLACEDNM